MERRSSREVYRNNWMRVREDVVRFPSGRESIFGVVEKPDFAIVVPREDDGSFWMVEQYRYPVDRRGWEFPMGSWGEGARGTPEELAAAELKEEAGLTARHLRRVGRLYQAYGYATQGFDVFLATGLEAGEPDREESEQDMTHRKISPSEFVDMVRTGEIVDGPTLAALGLLTVLDW